MSVNTVFQRRLHISLIKALGQQGAAGELRVVLAARCVAKGCEDGLIQVGVVPATRLDPAEGIYEDCAVCNSQDFVIYEDGDPSFEIALSNELDAMGEQEAETAYALVEQLRAEAKASRDAAFVARPFACEECGFLHDVRLLCGCAICGGSIALRQRVA